MKTPIILLCLLLAGTTTRADDRSSPADVAGPFQPTWESLAAYQCPEWFRDAKLGIWAHWTAQSVPEEGDWYARKMYLEGNSRYKFHVAHYGHPSKFGFKDIDHLWCAEKWEPQKLIALYKRAGARYFVALANHHDNFDCYDSKYQPWNSVNIGPKRDIVGEWAKAARGAGLRFGVTVHAARAWSWFEPAQGSDTTGPLKGVRYDGALTSADGKGTWWEGYDPQDLYAQNHEPGAKPSREYCDKFYNRTIDLIDKYRPDLLYFDDGTLPLGDVDQRYGLQIAAHLYNASVSQHGRNQAVMNTKGLREQQRRCLVWDIERRTPSRIQPLPWQTDTCIGSWHYARSYFTNHGYKTPRDVIHLLADVVSKNGNLLLNVPIRGDGTIDADEVACLEGLAEWMSVNGEAIFATRPWKVFGEGRSATAAEDNRDRLVDKKAKPFSAQDVRFTTSKDGASLYAIVLGAQDAPVRIRTLAGVKVAGVTLLGSEARVVWKQDGEGLEIRPVGAWPSKFAVVFKIALPA